MLVDHIYKDSDNCIYVLTIGIHVFYIVPIHSVDDVSKKRIWVYTLMDLNHHKII